MIVKMARLMENVDTENNNLERVLESYTSNSTPNEDYYSLNNDITLDLPKMLSISETSLNDPDTIGDELMQEEGRLSLAYEKLTILPHAIIEKFATRVNVLDLSYNHIVDISFLSSFIQLHTVILDKNVHIDHSTLPVLPRLEILWLNNCNIFNVFKWIYKIQKKCPNIRHLSMMGNPGSMSFLNGASAMENNDYRMFVLTVLPQLEYLDDSPFTREQIQLVNSDKTVYASNGGPLNFINKFGANSFCNMFRYEKRRKSVGSSSSES